METRFGTGVSLWLGQDVLIVGSLETWHKFLHACTRVSVSTLATLGLFWGWGFQWVVRLEQVFSGYLFIFSGYQDSRLLN